MGWKLSRISNVSRMRIRRAVGKGTPLGNIMGLQFSKFECGVEGDKGFFYTD